MSMLCPKCSELARCYDSRRTKLGHVKRMFRCAPCGLKFKSLEVIIEVRPTAATDEDEQEQQP